MALTGITSSPNITAVLTDVDLKTYSLEILYQAQPELFYEQLAEVRVELNKQPGQTIQFLKFNDISPGDELVEGTRMVTDDLSTGHVDISVREWGKAIAVTEYLLRTSAYDLLTSISKAMGDNFAITSNLAYVRTIMQNAPNHLYGYNKASRANMNASDLMTTGLLKLITEDKATRLVPRMRATFRGVSAAYLGMIHPHVAHQIKNDPEFIKAKHYGAPEDLFNGELGTYDDIRLIQTTFIPIIRHPGTYTPAAGGAPVTPPANVGHVFINGINMTDLKPLMFPAQTIVPGSPPIYQSYFFGDRSLALAETLAPNMRTNGIIDFERERELAWYAIRGTGIINADRILVVETF